MSSLTYGHATLKRRGPDKEPCGRVARKVKEAIVANRATHMIPGASKTNRLRNIVGRP